MPVRDRSVPLLRTLLLAGASASALLVGSPQIADAGSLRDRNSGNSAAAAATAAAQAGAQAAAAAAAQAMNRVNTSLQGLRTQQAAARAAAQSAAAAVPNGLVAGGLVVAPGAAPGTTNGGAGLWQGANLPTQRALSNGRTQVEVKQNEQKAILTWQSFNVGRETDLYFDQTAGGTNASNWIALNRVLDPSASPSRILGTIKAEGQVYIVNKNGIIFGGASQVNVHTLVASSLSLSNAQFMAGINAPLKIYDDPSGNSIAMPAFGYLGQQKPTTQAIGASGQVGRTQIGEAPGKVQVEAGGQIEAAGGGKVMLFAPHILNAGRVSAPDGQVIMAAGEQIYLTTNLSNVRGLDVAVSAPMPWVFTYSQMLGALGQDTIYDQFTISLRDIIWPEMQARAASVGYQVVNSGIVQADRGNITVMARTIAQQGALSASTSLNNREGSIRLLAWDQGMTCYSSSMCEFGGLRSWSTGTITLASGSVTAAMPDLSDVSEIELSALSTRYRPGRVDLHGKLLNVESQANVVVPAGTISMVASTSPFSPQEPTSGEPMPVDGSRIYIGEDAYLSVAGLQNISIAMQRNLVEAQLLINELRDSPLQKETWLRGEKIFIDRRIRGRFTDGPMAGVNWGGAAGEWIGTPLADVSAWIGVGKTDLAELSTVGGAITLKSSGSLITRQGSLLDVSGGSVRYRDGSIVTTKLLGADGRIYDIADATPDRAYVGIPGQFTRVHRDDRGEVRTIETWTSPLRAGRGFEPGYSEGRAAGAIQLFAAEGIVLEGAFWGGVVVGERQAATGKLAPAGTLTFGGNGDDDKRWVLGNLVISSDPVTLPEDFSATTALSSSWFSGGPNVSDTIQRRTTHLDADTLAQSGLGNIALYVAGDVALEKGTILELAPGSTFSVQANTVDAFTQEFRIDGVIRAPGGTVKLLEAEKVAFGPGAAIDLSGQWVNAGTERASLPVPAVIHGGSLQVRNARFGAGTVLDVSGGGWAATRDGDLELKLGNAGAIELLGVEAKELADVDLRGYAAGSGGSLTFSTSRSIQIGGDAPSGDTVRLSETLFGDRGFRAVHITSAGSVVVAPGATIVQLQRSVDLRDADLGKIAAGTHIRDMGPLAELPVHMRLEREPTSLTLVGATVTVGAGASVQTDIGGSIALNAGNLTSGLVEVAGRLEAQAGSITLTAQSGQVRILDTAALIANGLPVVVTDPRGRRDGVVLGGGAVTLSGTTVNVARGALIDISGSSGEVDMMSSRASGPEPYVPFTVASDAGQLTVGGRGLFEGTLLAHGGGGGGARGGTLSLPALVGSPVVLSERASSGSGLIVRPSAFRDAGLFDLLVSSDLQLDGVDLSLGGRFAVTGTLRNVGDKDSRVVAPYISLSGAAAAGGGSGLGTLTLAASVIDVRYGVVQGFAHTILAADDIRLIAPNLGQAAVLDVAGTLTLRAGQVYPASQTNATIKATDKIIVEQKGTAGLALSAAGILTLEAPVIEQGGTLRAPFGQIILKAQNRLTLGAGSVTSVSGDGLILPYGNLSNNEHWTITTSLTGQPTTISGPPEKRITLEAPTVDLAAGSVVDIRGGGDLHAWEHVPGPGGSHDMLALPGVYAIMPAVGPAVPADASVRAGDVIWLSGYGVPAGWYTLLPARYAMLPGARAIQAIGAPLKALEGATAHLSDGSTIVVGYRANRLDGSYDERPSSWRVMSGSVIRQYSEYNEAFANSFFASEAFKQTQYRLTGQNVVTPRLPIDGGAVVFKATQDLILNGQLRSQAAAGGRGGLVDIAAEKIAVVGAEQDASGLRAGGYLVIDATGLSGFGAGSLLLGGYRSGDARGLRVDVVADDIVVRNGSASALTGAEIILAASESIDIGAGSVITARGDAPSGAGDLIITPQVAQSTSNNGTPSDPTDDFVVPSRDWGALIRVSTGDAVRVRRENVDTSVGGQVTIGAGAVIDGGAALLIDATNNASVAQARLAGRSLSLAAGRIGFGGGSGLVLDAAALAALGSTQHLTLRSYSSLDFHAAVDLSGLAAVTFDAAVMAGYGSDHIAVVGNRIALENTAATFSEPVGAGHGSLSLVAGELVLGEGAKALRGFDTVSLTGTARIVGEGNGSLDAGAAAVTLSAPVLTGRGGAGQSVTTTGAMVVSQSAGAAPDRDLASLGARWSLTGRSIAFGGRIDALGGAVDLKATNGDVVLGDGSRIDVGGFAKQFYDVAEYANAGRIGLTAVSGSVLMQAGATLDLAADPRGGGAGSLAIVSDGSGVALDGTIRAQAAPGQRGGSFSVDIAALPSFAGLNQRLNDAGFSRSRAFRVRSGDVSVDGSTVVEEFVLVADQGRVTVAGTIDARATYGGAITIHGGNGLTMTSGAVLRAGATDVVDGLGSGRVTLGITGGTLAAQGGLIDVSGGEGGKVTLRAPVIEQPGPDTVNVTFAGTIAGAREIVLEGFKRFDLATLAANSNFVGVKINSAGQAELDLGATAAGKLNVLADYGAGTLVEFVRDFDVSAAYGGLGGLASQANFHARPGMELNHGGDIVLKSNWNLGAGVVDEAGALAAGVMAIDPILQKAYVVAGRQGDLLAHHTTMVYRTGGSIFGEPGVLTLRAGGDLALHGSISDGFFGFADPYDAAYLAKANSYVAEYQLLLNGGYNSTAGGLVSWSTYTSTSSLPSRYLGLTFATSGSTLLANVLQDVRASALHMPYSAAANAPAALGTLPGGAGDTTKVAELFPAGSTGGQTAVPASWSYALVAGATAPGQSADPLQRVAGGPGSITLHDQASFTYTANPSQQTFTAVLVDLHTGFGTTSAPNQTQGTIAIADWLNTIVSAGIATPNAAAVIALGRAGATPQQNPAQATFERLFAEFVTEKGLVQNSTNPAVGYRIINSSGLGYHIVLPVARLQEFYTQKILPNISAIASAFAPKPPVPTATITAQPVTVVRTGTGDIRVAANGDLQLKGGAAVYTAGRRDLAVLDDFTTAPASASYGVGGGHLRIDVGGNIDVALPADRSQMQHYTEWLNRQGATDRSYAFVPYTHASLGNRPAEQSSWWVDYGNFQRGVGALGGGNVNVSAGGDLVNLTVAVPTNGRVRGGRTTTERKLLELRNGGEMTVEAGGAVRAGYYYLGRGAGTIDAGEFGFGREVNVTNQGRTTSYPIAPILSLGDATLDVRTAGGLTLQTVLDPLMVGKGDLYELTFMSTLTERSALSLTSVGGDVVLVGQTQYLSKDLVSVPNRGFGPYAAVNDMGGNLYPSKTRITALNGSVVNNGTLYTMPSSSPELRIFAGEDVLTGTILMTRAQPSMMPSPLIPVSNNIASPVNFYSSIYTLHQALWNEMTSPPSNINGHQLYLYQLRNPEHLANEADYDPSRIYALKGSIVAPAAATSNISPRALTANEQTWLRAGTDIRNVNFDLRNIHGSDVSLLEAGNDIIAGTLSVGTGFGRHSSVRVQGPGALVLSAGRDVYGPTFELYSTGNRTFDENNRPLDYSRILGLPDRGAAITVMAGLGGKQPSYEAFLRVYVDPANVAAMPDYLKVTLQDGTQVPLYLTDAYEPRRTGMHRTRTGLVSFIEDVTGERLSPLEAWTRFQTLPGLTQERFARQVYMQELREAGTDQNEPGKDGMPRNGGYNRGYAAIETLLPGTAWKGDVTIGNALFRTMAGGDIEVLSPGGGLQVAALGTAAPSGYGLVTLGDGGINIFARDNVTVNRSRILTFAGGDEIIWSTLGDIDAGRGAKTARVPSAPEIKTDADTVTRTLERADISGSGIGTIIGFSGVHEGDVHLIAPQGTVNAGDAGVRVSGNLTVAARFVLNIQNFEVAGEVKGVPKQEAKAAPLSVETKDKSAADAARDVTQQAMPSERPSVIIVEILGYGGGDGERPGSDRQQDEEQRRREQGSYNPSSAVQFVGAGTLTDDQRRRLAATGGL